MTEDVALAPATFAASRGMLGLAIQMFDHKRNRRHWITLAIANMCPFLAASVSFVIIAIHGTADFWPPAAWNVLWLGFVGMVLLPFPISALLPSTIRFQIRWLIAIVVAVSIGITEMFLAVAMIAGLIEIWPR